MVDSAYYSIIEIVIPNSRVIYDVVIIRAVPLF